MGDTINQFKNGINKLLGISVSKEDIDDLEKKLSNINDNNEESEDNGKSEIKKKEDDYKSKDEINSKLSLLKSEHDTISEEIKITKKEYDDLSNVESGLKMKITRWQMSKDMIKNHKNSLPNIHIILKKIAKDNVKIEKENNEYMENFRSVSLPDIGAILKVKNQSDPTVLRKSNSFSHLVKPVNKKCRKVLPRRLFNDALATYDVVMKNCSMNIIGQPKVDEDGKAEESKISIQRAEPLFNEPIVRSKSNSNKIDKTSGVFSKKLSKNMKSTPSVKSEGAYLYRMEALNHYKKYIGLEIAYKKEKLLLKKSVLERMIIQKQQLIDDVLLTTNAHLYDPNGVPRKPWMQRLAEAAKLAFFNEAHDGRHLSLREQLYKMHEFMPIFTYFMCVLQLAVNIIMISQGGFTIIGLEPKIQVKTNIPTFMGLETIEHYTVPNIWMGPDALFFINYGAVNGPCIRDDIFISMMYAKQGYGEKPQLGCCEMPNRHAAATTTQTECEDYTNNIADWVKGVTCSERQVKNASWVFNHVMRPCCFSMKMRCRMLSHEHCAFLEGKFFLENMKEPGGRSASTPDGGVAGRGDSSARQVYSNKHDENGNFLNTGASPPTILHDVEHCSQVNCVSTICGFQGRNVNTDIPYLTKGSGQWFRLILSLFQHHGVIHVMAVVVLQLLMGHQIEIIAGWLRLSIIYFTCGTMGLLMGAVINPFVPHIGGTPAVMGLIGCSAVELVQTWSLVANPYKEAIKLTVISLVFFMAGTLPFVDNVELVTGFVFGIMMGVVLLPYVTFGRRHAFRKRIIVAFTLPAIFICVFVIFFLYLQVQWVALSCPLCSFINCVPYTKSVCNIPDIY